MPRSPAILLALSILAGCAGSSTALPPVSPEAAAFVQLPRAAGPPVVAGCQIFPAPTTANPTGLDAFNQDISKYPLDKNSNAIIGYFSTYNIHPDFGHEPYYGIPFNVVPYDQPKVPIKFVNYPSQSEPGPYPFPPKAEIEGMGKYPTGDRHVLVLQQGKVPGDPCTLYEVWQGVVHNGGKYWTAANGAIFHLNSTKLRPNGWTSADAAGLPIFPALIKCDEVKAGAIDHALRITFNTTRQGYIHPATHLTYGNTGTDLPAMGARFRLKAAFDISHFNRVSQIILTAMKKYGLFVADNGTSYYFQGQGGKEAACWNDNVLDQLKSVPGNAFEVVYTGPVLGTATSDATFLPH